MGAILMTHLNPKSKRIQIRVQCREEACRKLLVKGVSCRRADNQNSLDEGTWACLQIGLSGSVR
jgi:hypothetical protein